MLVAPPSPSGTPSSCTCERVRVPSPFTCTSAPGKRQAIEQPFPSAPFAPPSSPAPTSSQRVGLLVLDLSLLPARSFGAICTFLRPHELARLKGVSCATSRKICEINRELRSSWRRWGRRRAPPANTVILLQNIGEREAKDILENVGQSASSPAPALLRPGARKERHPESVGFDLSGYDLPEETLMQLLDQTDGIVGLEKEKEKEKEKAGANAGSGKGAAGNDNGDDNGHDEEANEGGSRAVVAAGGSGWCVTGLRVHSLRMVLDTRGVGGLRTPWLQTVHAPNLSQLLGYSPSVGPSNARSLRTCTSNSELRLLCEMLSDLPALTDLDLSGNNFHQHCLAMESRRPGTRTCTDAAASHDSPFHRIGFHSNRGTWRGVRPTRETSRCACMDGELGATGCAELAAMVVTPTLRTLNLSGTCLGGPSESEPESSLRPRPFRTLATDNALIFGLFGHAVCAAQSITTLDLSGNPSLGPRCAGILSDTICGGSCRQLVKLDLSGSTSLTYAAMPPPPPPFHSMHQGAEEDNRNREVDIPFTRLCAAIHRHSHIVNLQLEAAGLLSAHQPHSFLFSNPRMHDLVDDALVEMVSTPSLRTLGLRGNAGVDFHGARLAPRKGRLEAMCRAIQAASNITDLDLSCNHIEAESAGDIVTTLLKTPSLVRLNLAQNRIGGTCKCDCREALSAVGMTAKGLWENDLQDAEDRHGSPTAGLTVLDLRENNLGPVSLSMLVELHEVVLV